MQGYSAYQIGTVIIWMGLPQLVIIPFVPKLMQLFDSRYLVAFGMLMFGSSCFLTSYFNRDFSGPQIDVPLLIRAIGQPFIMVPLSAVSTAGMAKGRETGAASALFNMLRNLGGSFAIAGLSTLLSVRERFHSFRIGESVSIYSEATRDRLQHMTDFFISRGADPVSAQATAVGSLGFAVRQQSFFMAYNDCFVVLAFVLLASVPVMFFMSKQKTASGGEAH
jgi:MFS transporter, DHA2 family, multidrug resistance protein